MEVYLKKEKKMEVYINKKRWMKDKRWIKDGNRPSAPYMLPILNMFIGVKEAFEIHIPYSRY